MKAAPDRPRLFDGSPFAFGAGEHPVEGFTICDGLGRGDLGETYLAADAQGRSFVLRRLTRGGDGERNGDARRGPRKMAHVVTAVLVTRGAAGEVWLAREYQRGWSLADVLAARDAGMPLKEALRWAKGIGAGLHEIAAAGGVHGRLKPSNVWLVRGVVKLVDGDLNASSPTPAADGARDAARYAAPETALGRCDKADLYALGAILVEMLAGRNFDPHDDWQAWLAEPYRPILARALDPDPLRRWANVEELLAALDAAPQNLPPPRRAAPPSSPLPKHEKASVLTWLVLAAALLILALTLALMQSASLPRGTTSAACGAGRHSPGGAASAASIARPSSGSVM